MRDIIIQVLSNLLELAYNKGRSDAALAVSGQSPTFTDGKEYASRIRTELEQKFPTL